MDSLTPNQIHHALINCSDERFERVYNAFNRLQASIKLCDDMIKDMGLGVHPDILEEKYLK